MRFNKMLLGENFTKIIRRGLLALSLFMFFSARPAFSQNAQIAVRNNNATEALSLTVEDAVNYAVTNSKALKSAAIDLEIKKRASASSWNTFLPSLSASVTAARTNYSTAYNSASSGIMSGAGTAFAGAAVEAFSKSGDANSALTAGSMAFGQTMAALGDYEDDEASHWAVMGNLGLQWNFNLAMVQSIVASKKQYESGLISWEQTSRDTEVNIRKLFYGILLQQENVNIQKESLENARQRWVQAEVNYKNGMVPRISMLNAKVTYENKKPGVLSAEQGLKQNKELFAFLLGLPYGREIKLTGSIDSSFVDVNADQLFEKYISQNKDIQSLKKNRELLQVGINAKLLSTFTPSLSVNWGYQPRLYAMGDWIDSDIGIGEANDGGNLSFTLVYSNIMDWLPFSSSMQSVKDQKKQLEQIDLALEQLYQNSEIEVHKLCDNLKVAKENIEAMQRNVTIAREAYDSTLKAYNAGTQERLELQDSETQLNQAKLGLLNEKYNYISAVLDLETKLDIKLK
ncbi:MAG: TolC family protein [Treponema sp.]|nr:TolC family protein [Treponema sp.]